MMLASTGQGPASGVQLAAGACVSDACSTVTVGLSSLLEAQPATAKRHSESVLIFMETPQYCEMRRKAMTSRTPGRASRRDSGGCVEGRADAGATRRRARL